MSKITHSSFYPAKDEDADSQKELKKKLNLEEMKTLIHEMKKTCSRMETHINRYENQNNQA